MRCAIYQVDAFTSELFRGNPAAVVPLDRWLDDEVLQAIAQENNLSETAFIVASDDEAHDFDIRWMTPAAEVKLCGHATVGAAHVLYEHLGFQRSVIRLHSKSGTLVVSRDDEGKIELDFPEIEIKRIEATEVLIDALGVRPSEVYDSYYLICVFENEAQIRRLDPDFRKLLGVPEMCAIGVTAPGDDCDFVARLFAPAVGIDEDPVTGSLYTMLTPYWAKRLGKQRMHARQVSRRSGDLIVGVSPDVPGRVTIAGHAVTYMTGEIELPGG
ncbi:MAG: PhzF family phenazine biosynthesis protein [Phycisphaerales bacterium JB052]